MIKELKLRKILALVLVFSVFAALVAFSPNSEEALATPYSNYITIEGSLASAGDVFTTEVTVDYSLAPKFHIFYVRTGYTGFSVKVTDIDNNSYTRHMNGANMGSPTGREWTPLWNAGNYTGEVTYQITVTVNGAYANDCSFVIIIDTHEAGMNALSGPNYIVPLERFLDMPPVGSPILSNNLYRSFMIPTGDMEEYYSFVATGNDTVSFQSAYEGLRFRIEDPADNNALVFGTDTASNSLAHSVDTNGGGRNHFTRWNYKTLTPGKKYYVVLYRASTYSSSPGYIDSSYALSSPYVSIAVGGPRLRPVNMELYESSTTMSVNSTTTFSDRSILVSGLPKSAYVTRFEVTHRGTTLSNFKDFRYRYGTTAWTTSVGMYPVFTVPYTYLGANNTPANGTWWVGYRAGWPPLTITPGMRLSYYYELGNFEQG